MNSQKRYTLLLSGLVLIFLLSPIAQAYSGGKLLIGFLSIWILIASVYAVWDSTQHRVAISILGVLGLFFELFRLASESLAPVAGSLAVQIPFFLIITWVLFKRLLSAGRIDIDIILGSICVYFLLGLTWGFFYQSIEILSPGSFHYSYAEHVRSVAGADDSYFVYFSFITMTTIGYGDVIPLHPIARSIAMLQGVTGQMYIAILVARLVALHTMQNKREEV